MHIDDDSEYGLTNDTSESCYSDNEDIIINTELDLKDYECFACEAWWTQMYN